MELLFIPLFLIVFGVFFACLEVKSKSDNTPDPGRAARHKRQYDYYIGKGQ